VAGQRAVSESARHLESALAVSVTGQRALSESARHLESARAVLHPSMGAETSWTSVIVAPAWKQVGGFSHCFTNQNSTKFSLNMTVILAFSLMDQRVERL